MDSKWEIRGLPYKQTATILGDPTILGRCLKKRNYDVSMLYGSRVIRMMVMRIRTGHEGPIRDGLVLNTEIEPSFAPIGWVLSRIATRDNSWMMPIAGRPRRLSWCQADVGAWRSLRSMSDPPTRQSWSRRRDSPLLPTEQAHNVQDPLDIVLHFYDNGRCPWLLCTRR